MTTLQITVTALLLCSMIISVATCAMCIMSPNPKRLFFVLLTGSIFIYVLGCLLEATSASYDEAWVATRVKYFGAPFVGPLFFLCLSDYCNIKVRRPIVLACLFIMPLFNMFLVNFSNVSEWFFKQLIFDAAKPVPVMAITPGPFYYVHHLWTLICVLAVCCILIAKYPKWNTHMRSQIRLILLAGVMPQAANFFHFFNVHPWGINIVPVSLVLSQLFAWIIIWYYGFYDTAPKAVDLAIESMPEGLLILDADNSFVAANKAALAIFPELVNMPTWLDTNKVGSWPRELVDLRANLKTGQAVCFSRREPIGMRHYELKMKSVEGKAGVTGWMILMRDITDTIVLVDHLKRESNTDYLTGLFNRRYLDIQGQREFLRAKQNGGALTVMAMDLDFFKNVNDTYGHSVGDKMLIAVSERIKLQLRPHDWLSRYGGEEFVALVVGLDQETSMCVAERICQTIAGQPFSFDGMTIPITLSVGVAILAPDIPSLETLMIQADHALYRAKQNGRNQVQMWSGTELNVPVSTV